MQDPIKLSYYIPNSNDDVYGEYKVDSSKDAINKIDALKKKGSVVVITNDVNTYSGIAGITVKTPENVQGGEYDYAVIDIDFQEAFLNSTLKGFKMLYMATQRSKKGTIIVDEKNALANKKIMFVQDVNAANEFSLSQSSIDNYKEWKLGLMLPSIGATKWEFKEPDQVQYTADMIRDWIEAHKDLDVIKNLTNDEINEWIKNILDGVTDDSTPLNYTYFDTLYKIYNTPPVRHEEASESDDNDAGSNELSSDKLKQFTLASDSTLNTADKIRTSDINLDTYDLDEFKKFLDEITDKDSVDRGHTYINTELKKVTDDLSKDPNNTVLKEKQEDLEILKQM